MKGTARALVCLSAVFPTACGGGATASAPPSREPAALRHEPRPGAAPWPAHLRFYGVRLADGVRLDRPALLAELAEADAVCVGESHDEVMHHAAQLAVLLHLAERAPRDGRELALGLEMVEQPFQRALDSYSDFELTEGELALATEWRTRWGFDFSLYEPLFRAARAARVKLLALNAPRDLARKIARGGVESLSADERRTLPELRFDDSAHRDFFRAAMVDHPMEGRVLERMYQAQVLWDESMADAAARWLADPGSPRQIVVAAGLGHCHEAAIVARLKRRVALKGVSVRPISVDERAAQKLSKATPPYDYDLVFEG